MSATAKGLKPLPRPAGELDELKRLWNPRRMPALVRTEWTTPGPRPL